MKESRYGWQSDLPSFIETDESVIESSLRDFVDSPSGSQLEAWRSSIKWLKREYEYCVREDSQAAYNSTILEYELPRDLRRPDVIVLQNGTVVIIEIKGQLGGSQAAKDQVLGYARDLRAYHRSCVDTNVVAILVPTNGPTDPYFEDNVWIVGPSGIHTLLSRLNTPDGISRVAPEAFLDDDAYAPLPSIVKAARDLFHKNPLPRIKRARAATDPALEAITEITRKAAEEGTRNLVLLSGVPGAGKTLVGLQVVHAGWLDEISVERDSGKPSLPAVYLSGNGPLVQVLQDALKKDGADGKTFVQAIKSYVSYYSRKRNAVPPEHLVVFDEAQRAHDANRVAHVHKKEIGQSEPEHLIDICKRIPKWNVLVALIGSGQAIHVGEEGGVELWKEALRKTGEGWKVHGASSFSEIFISSENEFHINESLNLDKEIRFHLTPKVHVFVASLLDSTVTVGISELSDELWDSGHRFLITRDLNKAKEYLRGRYEDAPEARYGMLASSKDKVLANYGVDNTFQTTKRLKVGPWYNSPPLDALSCCRLETVATEFSSQGLELDFALLGWGCDLLWDTDHWSMSRSRGTRDYVEDPLQLRKNVYRVLLTRGRDGTVVFVPDEDCFDKTYERLCELGFRTFT